MNTTKSKFARRYDREFKENAVALVRSGKTATDVPRDLGVSHWSLSRWVQLAEMGGFQRQVGTLDSESPQDRQMRRMRQEIDYPRRQRDILLLTLPTFLGFGKSPVSFQFGGMGEAVDLFQLLDADPGVDLGGCRWSLAGSRHCRG